MVKIVTQGGWPKERSNGEGERLFLKGGNGPVGRGLGHALESFGGEGQKSVCINIRGSKSRWLLTGDWWVACWGYSMGRGSSKGETENYTKTH